MHISHRFSTVPRMVVFLACCAALAGCAAKDKRPEKAPERTAAVSIPAEAKTLFTEARALWRGSVSSVSEADVCDDPEKAVGLLSKAVSIEPDYAEAYARRGLALSEMGERDAAFDDLTTAVRLQPKAENYAYRGLVSLRAGQDRAAERDFAYSLKLQPSQSLAHNFLGLLELKRGDTRKACGEFHKGCAGGDCAFMEAARKEKLCP